MSNIINRLKSRLRNLWRLFICPPKTWKWPSKSQILIYDARGEEFLLPYMQGYRVALLHMQGERVNIPVMILATLRWKFWVGKPLQAYIETFIQITSPKVIVTFIDNNINYYLLSNRFPKIKTIFLQNGVRGGPGDVFASIVHCDDYRVDYMLVFNAEVGKAYSRYIQGEVVACGSLKNNHKKVKKATDGSVLFVSQFRLKPSNGRPFFEGSDNTKIFWEEVYAAEVRVLGLLKSWCTENRVLLRIAGCTVDDPHAEFLFFKAHLGDSNWEHIPKTDAYCAYELVDAAEIVVFIDSSLGFESIGRGKKTAAFSCRSFFLNDESMKFGWPALLPDSGPFWSNAPDEQDFLRVMNYLHGIGPAEWEQVRQMYVDKLMEFDPGNSQFVSLLGQLILEPT